MGKNIFQSLTADMDFRESIAKRVYKDLLEDYKQRKQELTRGVLEDTWCSFVDELYGEMSAYLEETEDDLLG